MNTLAPTDNFLVLQVNGEYDQLIESIRKTEISVCLKELASSSGRKLDVVFNNQ